ncbi:type II secretion system F family protein, partial [Thermoproteota archaeon]
MFSIYRLFAKIFPRNLKKQIVRLLEYSHIDVDVNRFLGFQLIFSALLSAAVGVYLLLFLDYNFFMITIGFFVFSQIFIYMLLVLSADKKAKFIESILPDVLQLMSSNLRTGVTIEKALFLSARPEFGPFKKELDKVGKEIAVGKDVNKALKDLGTRVKSDKLEKAVYLIINGIKSGGKIAQLLERIAQGLRDQEILDKKIRANISMYRIFITIAIGFAAPFLFGLSTVVVEIITKTFSGVDISQTESMPLSMANVGVSVDFIVLFSIVFILTSVI